MLTSRKALMSNLNFVHLQHVSLGVHLSMHPEVTDAPNNQDTIMKYGCQHKWRDTTEVDQNSNDLSVPCRCCDLHTEMEASLHYSSLEDLDTIIRNECLSPDDLPLSPLSLSSPSTDSSSSSDFTLDDSPASMYYKEYSQDGLDTPDQQPDIIPLDVALEGPLSPRSNTILSENPSETNNNMEVEDTPFIDWSSMLDSNSNTLIERSGSSSLDSDTTTEHEVQTNKAREKNCTDHWSEEQDLLSGLLGNASSLTPKKTITSFHELALRRRRSGGLPPSQVKRDRSDWLIVFSPDNEQPPMNELTASAFYHGIPELQTQQLSAAKEVTTFREMRYRNYLNKLSVHEERPNMTSARSTAEPSSIEVVWGAAEDPNHSKILLTTKPEVDDSHDQRQGPPHSKNMDCRTVDANIPSPSGHAESVLVDTQPAFEEKDARREVTDNKVRPAETWIRGMADGGDHRGQEVSNLRPVYLYSLLSPHCSARPSGPAQLSWYSSFPPRLSPLGASSPPHRALLHLLDLPDKAILQSPMFPRRRTYLRMTRGGEARGQALTDPPDTGYPPSLHSSLLHPFSYCLTEE
ncbi:RUN and SH3 domain-containing protein 1-like [Bufo gargarizans]|uniref:RUN and SH3 domain-containing protein 1-like n=1 Tax=Bufo gargarizans TaxID=30331 RepID=UPI001CF24FDB|nr:RUN and SH3 domain-containing protein 1-like [Bufo gargarizans]